MGVGTIRVGKITATGGDGTYTFTEQLRSAAGNAWENASAAAGVVGGTLQDINDSTAGAVDDLIVFWLESGLGGHTYYMTDVVGLRAPVLDSRAFVKDFWFGLTGSMNPAESVDDSQDYRNRIISAQAYWAPGFPQLADDWSEDGVHNYDLDGKYVDQDSTDNRSTAGNGEVYKRNLGLMLEHNEGEGGEQDTILDVMQPALYGEFWLKVDQDSGDLFVLHDWSTEANDWHIRVRLVCGAQVTTAEVINIS